MTSGEMIKNCNNTLNKPNSKSKPQSTQLQVNKSLLQIIFIMINCSQKSSTNESDCSSPREAKKPNLSVNVCEESNMSVINEEIHDRSNQSSACLSSRHIYSSGQSVFDHNVTGSDVTYIKKVQAKVRMILARKRYHQKQKMARYRRFVLQELVESEAQYVSDIEILIKQVLNPVEEKQLLAEDQLQQVFRNIRQLAVLNGKFLTEMQEQMAKYSLFAPFGKIIEKYALFFKVYYEYSSNYQIEYISQLRVVNTSLDSLLSKLEEEDVFRGLNIEAFLIKPVQRLPKYVLLLKDLIKHTWTDHPDYYNLKSSLDKFLVVNKQIDQLIDKCVQNQFLFELQRKYFQDSGMNIVESTRRFIQSESLGVLVSKEIQKSVNAHVCNDFVILTSYKETTWKTEDVLFDCLTLNAQSFCKNIDENKYQRNVFTLCGENKSITFICTDKEQKEKLIQLFDIDLIPELKEQKQLAQHEQVLEEVQEPALIRVFTKGTEIRSEFLSQYTVYVMLISLPNNHDLTVSVRYKNLTKLEQMVKQEFGQINLPHLSKKKWIDKNKSTVIEARKLLIENFLQTLLNSQKIQQKPCMVLNFLGLPPSLYKMAEVRYTKVFTESTGSCSELSGKQTVKSQSMCIYAEGDIERGVAMSAVLRRLNERQSKTQVYRVTQHRKILDQQQCKQVKVFLMNNEYRQIPTSAELRVADLVYLTAQQLSLQCYEDFKLYLVDGKELRLLDDEDSFRPQKEQENSGNLLQRMSVLFKETDQRKLVLKKYLYLDPKLEQRDYMADGMRRKLMTHQGFDDLRNDFFILQPEKVVKYCAYYMLIKHFQISLQTFTPVSLNLERAKECIPDKYLKGRQDMELKKEIFTKLSKLRARFMKESQGKDSMKILEWAELRFLKSIQKLFPYGYQLFEVQVENETKVSLKQTQNLEINQRTYLAINYENMSIIQMNDKSTLLTFRLSDIVEPQFYPFNVILKIEKRQCRLQFRTTNGLEIKKLYQTYTEINH